jgi:hypothetical protein
MATVGGTLFDSTEVDGSCLEVYGGRETYLVRRKDWLLLMLMLSLRELQLPK